VNDLDYINNEFNQYRQQDASHKDKIRQRNKIHQNQVVEQIKEEPRTFAKTGVAIMMQ
jgi:hypothetical protein